MMKNGLKRLEKIDATPLAERDMRRLTTARLRQKLDLEKYNSASPLVEEEIKTQRLYISLRQNIGAPSVPCAAEGASVCRGDIIAEAPENSLGLPIHSPINGKVLKVSDTTIIIESAERK